MQKSSGIIDDTNPVGITICCNSNIKMSIRYNVLKGMQRCCRRSRQFSAKKRIMPVMNRCNFTPGCLQNHAKRCFAHSVHGIQHDTKITFFNRFHIDFGNDTVNIFIQRTNFSDQPFCKRLFIIHPLRCFLFCTDIFFNFSGLQFICIPSSLRKNFDPIIDRRIMTCRDHHAIRKFMFHYIKHYKRCR